MDRKTQHILGKISSSIPRHLARNTTKVLVDTTEEEKARIALKSPDISKAKKNRLARLLERGAFRRSQEVVNDEVVEQIDQYNTRAVARARRSGKLKDPMTDPFYRKRMLRAKRIAEGLETPTKQKPYSEAELNKARQLLKPSKDHA